MSGKWTQGPWLSGYSDTHYPNKAVWADGGMAGASQVCVMTDDFSARDANAHLIAAAPDLYEALQAMVDYCNAECGSKIYPGHQANKALAKARGEK